MLNFAVYALQVVICSGIMMLYYRLVLHNKRFHQYNRFYILSVFILSWLIPLGKIYLFDLDKKPVPKFIYFVANGNDYMDEVVVRSGFRVDWWSVATIAYVLICFAFVAVFVKAIVFVFKLQKKNPKEFVHNFWLVLTDVDGTPFSFFKYVFWNKAVDINSSTGKQMLQHELVHVNEKHSIDSILVQIILCAGWFNPFFWFAKRELNIIHEFIADKKSVENGDTAAFAAMLLTAAYPQQQHLLTHSFFFSPIKRRLYMLTQSKKPKFSYMRRIVILPLLAVVVLLFAFRIKHEEKIKAEKQSNVAVYGNIDSIPKNVLFVLDGKKCDSNALKIIDPQQIESINVLKDAESTAKYGEEGKNGVILIVTKKNSNNISIPSVFLAMNENKYAIKNSTGLPLSLTVFNRWGNAVYQKDNYNNDWNGTGNKAEFNGKELEEGTYYVVASTEKGKVVSFISLKRNATKPTSGDSIVLLKVNKVGDVLSLSESNSKTTKDSVAIIDNKGYIVKMSMEEMKTKFVIKPTPIQDSITSISFDPTNKAEAQYKKIFTVVQTPASFPGGKAAWQKYLERNLDADIPVKNKAVSGMYTVIVSFIIDDKGNISDVKAENNPGYGTAEEAVRVIKRGPAWIPAVQNGRKVICRHRQSITFKVDGIKFTPPVIVKNVTQKEIGEYISIMEKCYDKKAKFYSMSKEEYEIASSIYKRLTESQKTKVPVFDNVFVAPKIVKDSN